MLNTQSLKHMNTQVLRIFASFLKFSERNEPMTTIIWAVVYSMLQVRCQNALHRPPNNRCISAITNASMIKPTSPEVRGGIFNDKFPLSLSVKMPKAIYFICIKMHRISYT